jgi:hypothetical protein
MPRPIDKGLKDIEFIAGKIKGFAKIGYASFGFIDLKYQIRRREVLAGFCSPQDGLDPG